MRITKWFGTRRKGCQACPVTFRSISEMPPNAQACLEQTGGLIKLRLPSDIIPGRPPASHYSVARLWTGGKGEEKGSWRKSAITCVHWAVCADWVAQPAPSTGAEGKGIGAWLSAVSPLLPRGTPSYPQSHRQPASAQCQITNRPLRRIYDLRLSLSVKRNETEPLK